MKNAVLAFLLLAASLRAGPFVNVPAALHRPNEKGGYCAWASGTTFARQQTGRSDIDLVANRRHSGKSGPAHLNLVSNELSRRGVPHSYSPRGAYQNVTFPSVVSMRWGNDYRGRHAVLWVGNDGKHCYFVDPNRAGQTSSMSSNQFRKRWLGNAIGPSLVYDRVRQRNR